MMTVANALELALQHHRAGRLAEAEAIYGEILRVEPNHAGALHFLGVIAHQSGSNELAVQLIGRAVALDPNNPAAHSNLGEAYRALNRLDEATAEFRRALELKPGYTHAHNNLGTVLTEQGHLDDAIATLRRALETDPNCAEAYNNLGNALAELGRIEEAIAAFGKALELNPDYANAKFCQSLLWLLSGEYARGWPMYEARLDVYRFAKRNFPQPLWDGSSLHGRRVLVHAEQGFGDSIQFIRYASLIAERGGEVIVECQGPLLELFRGAKGVSEVVVAGDPLPAFDRYVPMLTQPLVFQTTLESIPRVVPYLFAAPARQEYWRDRLAGGESRARVGLAWAGRPEHPRDRIRNIPFNLLRPLFGVEGVEFHSLQLGRGTEQIREFPGAPAIIDLTEHITDFADTAALMMELDLIVTVDTAVAHLAGALGRPVWTLLPCVPDWRWSLEGETTPWYPTMRLFRQPARGDWEAVASRVADELAHWTSRQQGTTAD